MEMRPLKTQLELVHEGYNAEGALVFLDNFFEEEKAKLLRQMLICSEDDLRSQRQVYKYLCSLETTLKNKVITGIQYATEQSDK